MPEKHWVENSSQVIECKNSQDISETKMPERVSIPIFERTHIILFFSFYFFPWYNGKKRKSKMFCHRHPWSRAFLKYEPLGSTSTRDYYKNASLLGSYSTHDALGEIWGKSKPASTSTPSSKDDFCHMMLEYKP
jgi:hypothetical protein